MHGSLPELHLKYLLQHICTLRTFVYSSIQRSYKIYRVSKNLMDCHSPYACHDLSVQIHWFCTILYIQLILTVSTCSHPCSFLMDTDTMHCPIVCSLISTWPSMVKSISFSKCNLHTECFFIFSSKCFKSAPVTAQTSWLPNRVQGKQKMIVIFATTYHTTLTIRAMRKLSVADSHMW